MQSTMLIRLAIAFFATATVGVLPQVANAQSSATLADRGFKCDEPYYPAAALRGGATGRTILRVTTNDQGQIADVSVEQTSGRTRENKMLDLAAVQHMKSCRATPATSQKAETFTYELVWSLPGSSK